MLHSYNTESHVVPTIKTSNFQDEITLNPTIEITIKIVHE